MAERGIGRLNVLDLQIQIRRLPKPVVAMVAGYAIGGGHVLHLVCDLTIAADNARFGQTGPQGRQLRRGLRRRAARKDDRAQAREGDLVPLPPVRRRPGPRLGPRERRRAAGAPRGGDGLQWCREMLALSPIALRMLKAGFNAADDGLAGIQQLAGDATMLFYMSEEGPGGTQRLRRETPPRLLPLPAAPLRPVAPDSLTAARDWVAGARPRTLPAAVVPVVVGTAVASADGSVIWWRSLYALIVALAIQIGTNYANDYSDGVRGTDAERVGPVRLVAGGLASPRAVRTASFCAFGVAGVAGLVLALATTPWLLVVGGACIAAGWFYTGGPRPYGYAGFGEVFVFVFFGLVAVIGTAYVSLGHVTALAVVAAVPVGLLATALLVVNNLRDIHTDREAGKRTLAVRLGAQATRRFYAGCVIGALVLGGRHRVLATGGAAGAARRRPRRCPAAPRARRRRGA